MKSGPGIAVLLGHSPKADDEDAPEDKGMSPEEHKKTMDDAADEMFDAIKSGNKDHFRMALEAYCDLHKEAPEPEPSEEDMGDEDDEDGPKGGL